MVEDSMTPKEVIEILSNKEAWGGTAAKQIERRRREVAARNEAVKLILQYQSELERCSHFEVAYRNLSSWINYLHRLILKDKT